MIPDLPQMGKNRFSENVCARVEYFNGLTGGGRAGGERKRIQQGKREN
jgi:hypothetical protein